MAPVELTLVVAATRDMGIGKAATLPWTGLKKEMAYFARVTKRLPPQVSAPAMNAVIMGRKTWDSIPPKFRPLKDRLNIVISRSHGSTPQEPEDVTKDAVKVSSLEQAVTFLQRQKAEHVGRAFIIGGGQIYDAALKLAEARRILLTSIQSDFDCDTHFPIAPGGDGAGQQWEQASTEDLEEWTREKDAGGIKVENDVQYEFQMWERADSY